MVVPIVVGLVSLAPVLSTTPGELITAPVRMASLLTVPLKRLVVIGGLMMTENLVLMPVFTGPSTSQSSTSGVVVPALISLQPLVVFPAVRPTAPAPSTVAVLPGAGDS